MSMMSFGYNLENDDIFSIDDLTLLELNQYRHSPTPAAGASRPKRCFTSPRGEIYYKFDMENNETCAELFSYAVAKQLGIAVADTRLATYKQKLGIASFDIGEYMEPSDADSYSIKDFTHIIGFVTMCLYDYLIMNEDRHAGNWGINGDKIATLFDHNYSFGGPDIITDIDHFMPLVTSPFYVTDENKQQHDTILKYLVKHHKPDVNLFMNKLLSLHKVENQLWDSHFPTECEKLNNILCRRKEYMIMKVGEYDAGQINDNEF